MNKPLVSVIIPIYKEFLVHARLAINSILSQTYCRLEVLIIFDDPEPSVLKETLYLEFFRDERVIFIYNDENLGLANSLNKAIKLSKGYYIVRMDGDDISRSDRIQNQVLFMENNNDIELSGTYAHVINEDGIKIGEYKKPLTYYDVKKYTKFANPVLHPSWIVRKSLFQKVGYYDDISPSQDYAFIVKTINFGFRVANIPIFGIDYRIQKKSLSHYNSCKTLFITNILRDVASLKKEYFLALKEIEDFNYSNFKVRKINFILAFRSALIFSMKKHKKIYIPFYIFIIFIISSFSRDVFKDSIKLIKAKL
ncbi:MAG: glycosyltransferase [Gammaproteobacteria bacterium]|nr:glycosyltransferase [Gammaproteobacteria bacterium]MBU2240644.1 glycosyltransferase [Gammaproteobacteria bacterium]